jgi:surfactin synthase thioesterase subunit
MTAAGGATPSAAAVPAPSGSPAPSTGPATTAPAPVSTAHAVAEGARWLRGPGGLPERGWLLCVPHAGVGASAYLPWARLAPPGIALRAVQPPGHEERFREPPHRELRGYVRALLPAVRSLAGRPVAIFGHSLGAIAAFELASQMREAGLPPPAHLYLSGRQAPGVALRGAPAWDRTDEGLVEFLRELGGTPEAVLREPAYLEMLLPVIRADLEMNERYSYTGQPPLDVPLTVFPASADDRAPAADMQGWALHTTGTTTFVPVEGGHFAVPQQPRVLFDRVTADSEDWCQ